MTDEGFDDALLRERIARAPRPAAVWLGGVVVLVALEFGRLLAGLLAVGSALGFVLEGVASVPGWVRGNVRTALGPPAGYVAHDLTALLLLAVVASVLAWLRFPVRFVDLLGFDASRRTESYLERVILTALLAGTALVVAFTPVGGVLANEVRFTAGLLDSLSSSLPTLTGRETIPNQGHRTPGGGWSGTFFGLSPAQAWGLRTALVFAYVGACLAWIWRGYEMFREHYREADWTPRDDTVRRFVGHYWGLFGFAVVVLFVVLAAWAPAISPVPAEHNIYQPFEYEFEYLDEESGEVETIAHGNANLDTRSDGQNTVGPLSYDQYGRWAPLGTTPRGQDLLTNLAFGARTSLIIALTAIVLGSLIAVVLSLVTAYYKGLADLLTIVASDTIIAIPAFLLVMLLSVIFNQGNHPLAEPLDGGLLLALVFAFAFWPGMWRAIRGPSLQVAQQEWVDAARSYGQTPANTMRKHMAPYIAAYIIIYSSLLIGAVIIFTAALTFLGLGINSPTPEWGRLINQGRPYIATSSWHVATISGLMIVLVVTAFNALGDALRDAIDPETDVEKKTTTRGGGV